MKEAREKMKNVKGRKAEEEAKKRAEEEAATKAAEEENAGGAGPGGAGSTAGGGGSRKKKEISRGSNSKKSMGDLVEQGFCLTTEASGRDPEGNKGKRNRDSTGQGTPLFS
ncbi:hypothetical protein F5879DRAFT_995693 [Lentinula edodes]|nr:hypothetical protein F5879DRAFT_995693 [Lentinula edodes]